jgi:hypothetical protein
MLVDREVTMALHLRMSHDPVGLGDVILRLHRILPQEKLYWFLRLHRIALLDTAMDRDGCHYSAILNCGLSVCCYLAVGNRQYHWSMMRVRLPIISGPVQVMSKLIMNENTFFDHRKDGRWPIVSNVMDHKDH